MAEHQRAARLLIVGASVRAAAASAVRAGMTVVAADRFADADLAEMAEVLPQGRRPRDLVAAAGIGCDAWMYTGGIENHPRLVDRLAQRCPLWGNSGETLVAVREPFRVRELLAAGFDVPAVAATADKLPNDRSWLRKSRRGSGGTRVALWMGEGPRASRGYYFQQRVAGTPCSAAYVAARGEARLLGMTEQLLAPSLNGAPAFRYGGSLGPLPLTATLRATVTRLGATLAKAFSLVGLFGVDGLLDGERFLPVEVNPRYPASLEVLEQASGFSAVALHAAACRDGELPTENNASPQNAQAWFGKRVIYAPHELHIPAIATEWLLTDRGRWPHPRWADIPRAESTVPADTPLMTAFASGATREEVLQRLG